MSSGVITRKICYPTELPIYTRKDEIVEAIRDHPVVIVTGETGSGKTTQLPKMCLEAGRGIKGLIGCTEPRRVAAISLAHRLAEELGEEVGERVAYKVRFAEQRGPHAQIKVMTDGILLTEIATDRLLKRYDTLIVDEAHERSINIDFVLGYLRTPLLKRPDLKIIITSATIDAEKFSRAFYGAPILEVSGRQYPIDILWQPLDPEREEMADYTYIEAAVEAVNRLYTEYGPGDTLVFMPTEQDIRETCELLEPRWGNDAVILPLFARLALADQRKVFLPYHRPKIICATNVAETSLTIPGIRYVIDTGLARISWYNPRTKTAGLPIRPISRSSADQRSGRCGRVMDGICVRLFSEEDYLCRPLYTTPEILRSNLAGVLLQMLYLRLGNAIDFPFIDAPSKKHLTDAMDTLRELGAVTTVDGVQLSPLGKKMARLPLDPRVSRMVIEGINRGCRKEIVTIASVLGIGDPREVPREEREKAKSRHAPLNDPASDFLTFLRIWQDVHAFLGGARSHNKLRRWCRENFMSYRRMREWMEVHDQIETILAQDRGIREPSRENNAADLYPAIHQAILSGYLVNVAEKKERNLYRGTRGREIMLFPGSGLFNKGGKWIVAAEMVATSRLYARITANIEPEWVEEVGKAFCRYSYAEPFWDRERGDVMARERVTFLGLTLCAGRNVSFSRINPEEAHPIFIRSALMAGDVNGHFTFLRHNAEVIDRLRDMERKTRTAGLVDEEAIFHFYSERLAGVANISQLKHLIRARGGDDFLLLREEDCLRRPLPEDLAFYPDQVTVSDVPLPLTYRFEPGKSDDGVTLTLPGPLFTRISVPLLDRLVPGLLREKIAHLVATLPKEYRRRLPPLTDWLDKLYTAVMEDNHPLPLSLSRFIKGHFGITIPVSAWPIDRVPDFLTVRLALVGDHDEVIATGRDPEVLQGVWDAAGDPQGLAVLRRTWERTGLTTWDFEELPEAIPYEGPGGITLKAYPALVPTAEGVDLKLFSSPDEAEVHRYGVARLYERDLRQDMKELKKTVMLAGKMKAEADRCWGSATLSSALYQKVVQDTLALPIRTRAAYQATRLEVRRKLLPRAYEVLSLAAPVVEAAAQAQSAIDQVRRREGASPSIQSFVTDLERERERLAPATFLLHYPEDRLPHLVRYLTALAIRAERGAFNLGKDRARRQEIHAYEEQLAQLRDRGGVDPAAFEELAWMIEEYRVSLFAQELKTAVPVSPKRLREKLAEIEFIRGSRH